MRAFIEKLDIKMFMLNPVKIFRFLLLLLLATAGCSLASSARMVELRDDRLGIVIQEMVGNILVGEQQNAAFHILSLNPLYWKSSNGEERYYLMLHYDGDLWLFIKPEDGLVLEIDQETIVLSTPPELIKSDIPPFEFRVLEKAQYRVEPNLIRKLAYATEVTVRVVGREFTSEKRFGPANFKNLQDFAEMFCPLEAI